MEKCFITHFLEKVIKPKLKKKKKKANKNHQNHKNMKETNYFLQLL